MGTGVLLIVIALLASAPRLSARDVRCEEQLIRPTFESVRKNLQKKYPVVFRPLLKVDQELADATHEVEGKQHVFRFSGRMKKYSQPYQLGILLHESVHLASARHFKNPKSDTVIARGVEVADTAFKYYEEVYGFDELEARIREMAVLTQGAESQQTAKWDALVKGDDIRKNIRFQRLVIRKALEWIEGGETSVEIGTNFVRMNIKNCKRRSFCALEVPMREGYLEPTAAEDVAYEYIRRILAVRVISLDIHLQAMRGFFKRLDAL